jgi:acetyltransferase-like isoleucine patch superfamily enzyme
MVVMKNKSIQSKKINSFSRHLSHFLHPFAKSGFLNGNLRARLHKLRGVKFDDVASTFIGENVTIDSVCPQNVRIGKRCIITSGTKILTHYLDTENLSDNPSYHFRFYKGEVRIEDDVFIGYNVVIASPLRIGKGSIIGANTVLTKDVEPGSVMVGAQAKCIKTIPFLNNIE